MRSWSHTAFSRLSAGFLALSFAAATPPVRASDQTPAPILVNGRDARAASPQRIMVSASVVLLIDVSGSVDAKENVQMMEGIKTALRDGENLNLADCYAMTVVRYGSIPRKGNTHVVCNKAAMEGFITAELAYDPLTKPSSEFMLGRQTNIDGGVREARNVFMHERESLNVYAMQRRMVIMGDGRASGGPDVILPLITELGRDLGVTTYAIPIADSEMPHVTRITQNFYRQQLLTPESLTYVDRDVWGPTPQPVQPGQYIEAEDFTAVQRGVTLAMMGPGL